MDLGEWLQKAAGHKYLRRVPRGNPPPRYNYIYATRSKHHDTEHQVGEKVRVTHGKQAGHYEIKATHGDWVTLRHDETGQDVTIRKERLLQMFHDEHHKTKDPSQHVGGQKQAHQATTAAQRSGTEQAHMRAATQHEKLADAGVDAVLHRQLAEVHARAAQAAKSRKVVVRLEKKRPPKPGQLGTKQQAWDMLMSELSYDISNDYIQGNQAYLEWRDRRRSKPAPYTGGELDSINGHLDLKAPDRRKGKKDTRVSSLREGFEKLTANIRSWNDPRIKDVIQVLRDVPGLEKLRLPESVREHQDRLNAGKAQEAYYRDMHEHQGLDTSFDPDEIGSSAPTDVSFEFGWNVAEAEAMKSMSGINGGLGELGDYLEKAKYTKRTGTPGNYKYEYGTAMPSFPSGKPSSKEEAAAHREGMARKPAGKPGSHISPADRARAKTQASAVGAAAFKTKYDAMAAKDVEGTYAKLGELRDKATDPKMRAAYGNMRTYVSLKHGSMATDASKLGADKYLENLGELLSAKTEKSMAGIDGLGDYLEKAGPFIGPRGGKWADAKHTIPWQLGSGGVKERAAAQYAGWKGKDKKKPANTGRIKHVSITGSPGNYKVQLPPGAKEMMSDPKVKALVDKNYEYSDEAHDATQQVFRNATVSVTMKSMGGIDTLGDYLHKAGPFIGPRGGKWADAQHTIPWSEHAGREGISHKEVAESAEKIKPGMKVSYQGETGEVKRISGDQAAVLFAGQGASEAILTHRLKPAADKPAGSSGVRTKEQMDAATEYTNVADTKVAIYQGKHGMAWRIGGKSGGSSWMDIPSAVDSMQGARAHIEAQLEKLPSKKKRGYRTNPTEKSMSGIDAIGAYLSKADDGKPGESLGETSDQELTATHDDIRARMKTDPEDQTLQARYKAIDGELKRRGKHMDKAAQPSDTNLNMEKSMENGITELGDYLEKGHGATVGDTVTSSPQKNLGAETGDISGDDAAGKGALPHGETQYFVIDDADGDAAALVQHNTGQGPMPPPTSGEAPGTMADHAPNGGAGMYGKSEHPAGGNFRQHESVAHQVAQRVTELRKSDDVTAGINVDPKPDPEPQMQMSKAWRQGDLCVYTDHSDEAAAKLAKGEGFYHGNPPNVQATGLIRKSGQCANGHVMPAMLTSCPGCGVGASLGLSAMGVGGRGLVKAMGGLQPATEPDMMLPHGTVLAED